MSRRMTMTDKVEQYLAYRHDLGYELRREGAYLRTFGGYVDSIRHRGALTTEVAVRWARLAASKNPASWARRLELVRCFARYLAIFEPGTEIPPVGLLGSFHWHKTPHVYTEAEVSALVSAASQLRPVGRLRPRTYRTLIGLLACTGLRVSEALRCIRSDFDANQGILTIRETKFGKSRLVPLHPSVTKKMLAYGRDRDRLLPVTQTDRFFVADRGTQLHYQAVRKVFRMLCDKLGIAGRGCRPKPGIHDMRHTFACRRIARWYDAGGDVARGVPALSTYLGHATVRDTYWYLTATPELLNRAAARFEPFASLSHREVQP